jgi:hypothetical protein
MGALLCCLYRTMDPAVSVMFIVVHSQQARTSQRYGLVFCETTGWCKLYRHYSLYRPQHVCAKAPESRSALSLPRYAIANIQFVLLPRRKMRRTRIYQAGVSEESVAEGALPHNIAY